MISYVGVHGKADDQKTADFMCRVGDRIGELIQFSDMLILTASMPSFQPKIARVIPIQPLNYDQYNELAMKGLGRWAKADYIMTIHDDGFVVNPHMWSDEFLQFDYIGAPWKLGCGWSWEGREVGNGGFSLRSRRLYNECQSIPYMSGAHEDGIICLQNRDRLMSKGIKFGTLEVAYRFSIEAPFDDNHSIENCFGFHNGRHLERAKQILGIQAEMN